MTEVKLQLTRQQYRRIAALADTRSVSMTQVIAEALDEWLKREARLARGRQIMINLGQGLGESVEIDHVARNHDQALYADRQQ